ncbi:hypothetical protein BT96DRAFT_1050396 [Gymnopus androsaceus JB14]|uniref:Uncharacterized protein n=1 Tax=Gymnopus androsaceus JB14 TaxID=1447944 RepID=A0A6A4H7D5_9AGAR|nr:hypothetical protein BT96DRAFT_1050396 [Gymnopus androsaceus JB14]
MAQECMHAFDEIGFNNLSGGATQVIGRTGKKMQYQQRGANQEMTTVLVTICADGTSIPPAQIFKGKGIALHGSGTILSTLWLAIQKKDGLTTKLVWNLPNTQMTREKANG